MISKLVLHNATRQQLQSFLDNPSHALLLTGPAGIGKTAIAEALAESILQTRLDSHPYHLAIRPGGANISIDAVRQLNKFLQLKTVGSQPFRRTAIIEYAHTLTIEAQNALLKLLEEPPADTLLILTANTPRALLPTILSRTQVVAVNAPDEAQLQSLINSSRKSEDERRQAYFLSGGLPGLLHALLGEEEHPLLASIAQAKQALQCQVFERLSMVDGLSRQKDSALGLVEALERIAAAGLNGAAAKQDTARIKQWNRLRKVALEAHTALRHNTNAKLVLTNLFINM